MIVVVSGGFDPIHKGHIEYLKRAKELSEKKGKVICILNNDDFLTKKKGKPFMDMANRYAVLNSIRYIDTVIASIDEDDTVCETLKLIKEINPKEKIVFAKGGDRTKDEIPEAKTCEELGIEIIDGLGEKIESSSSILSRFNNIS